MFVIGAINKSLSGRFTDGYGNYPTLEKLKYLVIKLPIKDNKIDFDFMENFIAELEAEHIVELEAQHIAELEAYLLSAGLKDYNLTEVEEKVLDSFKKGKINFEEFYITDLFTVKNSGNILSRDVIENSGTTPYLCASKENNAIKSYISYYENLMDKGDCIFIGGKTFVVTYQENDFYSNDSHNLLLYLKDNKNKSQQLFLATCISKGLSHKYSWGNSISNKKIQSDKIILPSIDNRPDYSVMATFISVIKKLVIKDVVLYSNKKLEATKSVVNKNNM